ncbi:MAG: uroporphyrinogen decarboxylase family protein [Rudaea sp.]
MSRADILSLLDGDRSPRVPCFSGLVNITTTGLDALGLRFCDIHTDAEALAAAAAQSHALFGWESAVVPADLCVEASALGAEVDFRADLADPMWPVVAAPLAAHASGLRPVIPARLEHTRVAVPIEAIQILKKRVGQKAIVGAWIPGPLTLAMQLVDLDNLYTDLRLDPASVQRLLAPLADFLARVGQAYHDAGADLITIHEMGGSPGVVGPRAFRELVLPPLLRLVAALPAPRVLSVCGNTNGAVDLLLQAGAEAISVDQSNRLAESRRAAPGALIFGNIDPVAVLAEGDAAAVRAAVRGTIAAGVDAVWPGCDLPFSVPAENMQAAREEAEVGAREN